MQRRKLIAGTAAFGTATLAGCLGIGTPRGNSEYTGYVVDTEYERGLIFRNTTIHVKTDPKSGTGETFKIRIPEDRDLFEIAQEALSTGRRVRVFYKRGLFENPFDAFSNDSIVVDIKMLDQQRQQ